MTTRDKIMDKYWLEFLQYTRKHWRSVYLHEFINEEYFWEGKVDD